MLDTLVRILAHLLTPLFFAGLLGSALLVVGKFGSDITEFFEDDTADQTTDPRH